LRFVDFLIFSFVKIDEMVVSSNLLGANSSASSVSEAKITTSAFLATS